MGIARLGGGLTPARLFWSFFDTRCKSIKKAL